MEDADSKKRSYGEVFVELCPSDKKMMKRMCQSSLFLGEEASEARRKRGSLLPFSHIL
jgi:hypothetical protein